MPERYLRKPSVAGEGVLAKEAQEEIESISAAVFSERLYRWLEDLDRKKGKK